MMRKGLSIAACGAVCHDEIVHLDGHITHGYGGVLYSLAAFASVMEPNETLVPLTILGADHAARVRHKIETMARVDSRAVSSCPESLTHVRLVWTSPSARTETVKGRMPAVTAKELAHVRECAAVHFNFINGTEIDRATLAAFRSTYKGLVSVDVHQLISRFDDEGARTITGFPEWREWAPHIDVWQCNEYEAECVFGPAASTESGMRAAARDLLALGPRIVCFTLDAQGVFVAYRTASGMYGAAIEAYRAGVVVDTTGCGDSFSAGLITGLLHGLDPLTAAARGVIVAGETACLDGIQPIPGLTDKLVSPRRSFDAFRGRPADWPGDVL